MLEKELKKFCDIEKAHSIMLPETVDIRKGLDVFEVNIEFATIADLKSSRDYLEVEIYHLKSRLQMVNGLIELCNRRFKEGSIRVFDSLAPE